MAETNRKKLIFEKHKPTDTLDVSFRIKGHELKWLGPQAQENMAGGGVWQVLRKDEIDPVMLRDLESRHYAMFAKGDTIRHNELVLAYAPKEAVDEVRRENEENAKDAMDAIYTRHKNASRQIELDRKETSVERVTADSFNK